MSKSAYGGELRLISQVITLASKLGDSEQMMKTFAGNRELLAYVLDYVSFNHSRGFLVQDDYGRPVEIRLVCFSETSSITNDEANLRVARFGRYATENELKQLFEMLENTETRREICYPIVTHTIPLSYRSEEYEFKEITWRSLYGRIELVNSCLGGTIYKKTGLTWLPPTFFAVVPQPQQQQNWSVLSSRPKSDRQVVTE